MKTKQEVSAFLASIYEYLKQLFFKCFILSNRRQRLATPNARGVCVCVGGLLEGNFGTGVRASFLNLSQS